MLVSVRLQAKADAVNNANIIVPLGIRLLSSMKYYVLPRLTIMYCVFKFYSENSVNSVYCSC